MMHPFGSTEPVLTNLTKHLARLAHRPVFQVFTRAVHAHSRIVDVIVKLLNLHTVAYLAIISNRRVKNDRPHD